MTRVRSLSTTQLVIGAVAILALIGILYAVFPHAASTTRVNEPTHNSHVKASEPIAPQPTCETCKVAPACEVCKEQPKCPDCINPLALRLQKQVSHQLESRLQLYSKLSQIEEKCKALFNQFPEHTAPDFDPLGSGAAGKANIMLKYAKKFDIKYFVETGTFMGGTLSQMIPNFKKSYSIELSEGYYRNALVTFKADIDAGRCKLFQGDSASQLKEIVKELEGPALFWLDGHWSAGDTAMGTMDTPIFDEIKTVFSEFKYAKDSVIIIDDARLFRGLTKDVGELKGQLYPNVREIMEFLCVYSPYGPAEVSKVAFTLDTDMMIIYRKD